MDIEDEKEGRVENNLYISFPGNRAIRGKFLFCFVENTMELGLALDLRYLKDVGVNVLISHVEYRET